MIETQTAKNTPILDVAHRLDLPIRMQGSTAVTPCLWHPDGGRPNLTLFIATNTVKCFSCGYHGDNIDLVQQALGIDYAEAIRWIAGEVSNTYSLAGPDKVVRPRSPKLDVAGYVQHCQKALGMDAIRYLKLRGIRDATLVGRLKIGYDDGSRPFSDWMREGEGRYDYAHRLILPILDSVGRPIYFVARAIEANIEPRYKNCPGPVPGFFRLPKRAARQVVLCEGIMDAITLLQAGIPAIAAVGVASVQDAWLQGLRGQSVFIAFDNDEPGQKWALGIREKLIGFGIKTWILPIPTEYKDINEWFTMKENAAVSLRKSAALAMGGDRRWILNAKL